MATTPYTYLGPYGTLYQKPFEGQVSGDLTYNGVQWVSTKTYQAQQAAARKNETENQLLSRISKYTIPKIEASQAKNGDYLLEYNDSYLNAKNQLNEIITTPGSTFSASAKAAARKQLTKLEADFKIGSKTAYEALGKKPSDKDTPSIGQLAIYAKSRQPPDTKAILQENVEAMKSVLGEAANLELQYAPQLAQVTGQAQREQMIKNIQAATDTPEISALRSKETLTPAEQQTLAQYDAQFAQTPTSELAARADTLFNQAIQQGKLEQYQKLMPQYQKQYLEQMPGAEQTLQSLGQLGTQMAQRATQAPQLTAFEQQVGGPTYGQELGQIQGPTTGQYLGEVAGPAVDMTLGGMQTYAPGQFTGGVAGPKLQSDLGTIDQNIVNQYMGAIPGVAEASQRLGQQINLDLAAGRSLTPEQERLATQAAREAYAARGMALGPQAIGAEILNREELANQRYRERQAAAQQAMGTISAMYQPALTQAYARQAGAEQYGLGAQAQAFGQAMSKEDLSRVAQAQEYQQRFGLQELGLGAQAQQYQQALGREQLGLSTQAQQFGQAATREQQQAAIQGQQFNQALARGEAESGRIQAANTLQANQAQIAASTLGTQQQAMAPAMAAYFNVPPSQGAYGTSANQAQNQYAQAGLNIANPTNPVITGLNMMPYQNVMSQYSNQANFAASYLQGRASAPSGGGGGGGMCCFIMLEARYGNGVMDEVVRRYREEHVTPRNQRGYYKLAKVFVPLMRKSKLFKFAVSKLFADPLVSFAKWHYGQNKHGWVFKPIKGFWMNVFDLLGEDVPFIRENGEVV